MKLNYILSTYRRIKSKWIKDLNVNPKTIKLLGKNISNKISLLLVMYFLTYLHRRWKIKKEQTNGTTSN